MTFAVAARLLSLQVSHSWGTALGSLVLPVRELLIEPGLVLDRWLGLEGALPESQVLLRAMLKVSGHWSLQNADGLYADNENQRCSLEDNNSIK